jgi:LysR family transcriptional regulator, nitrogen assimilation regulatory protein
MGKRWVTSLEDLRLYAAVYEERSFTRAAERENSTQSGVSQHVRKIERLFDVKLFIRKEAAIVPTPAGHVFYQRCIDILRRVGSADDELRQLAGTDGEFDGEVTVGLIPTVTRCALAPALMKFTSAHPNVSLKVIEAYSGALSQLVLAGDADFAIVPATEPTVGLVSAHVLTTPEVLVSSPNSSFQHLSPIMPGEFSGLKLIVPGPDNVRRATLENYLVASDVQIARFLELDAMMATLDLIARSDWVAVLPGIMMGDEIDNGRFKLNPLSGPTLSTGLTCITAARKVLSPVGDAFRKVLADHVTDFNRRWDSFLD